MKIKVSELIVRYLQKLGIKHIFGMPGAHILPVYDSLYDSDIQAVLAKHEQGAAFMACGYSRANASISACITTAGPGATNLVTGIANAYADKQPILAITGEAPTHIFGKGGLQESSGEGGSIDQSSLFKGITRYHKIVERTDYLANILNRASKILLSDQPGPVLLSFPYNVQNEQVDENLLDQVITSKNSRHYANQSGLAEQLATHLQQAKNPVIVAGYGCILANAGHSLKQLCQLLNIPLSSSLKAKGIIHENSELSLGSLGVTSSGYAYQYITQNADLILFLGAGFNERTSYVWQDKLLQGKTLIQIDADPQQLEKVFKADLAICADIEQSLQNLLSYLEKHPIPPKTLPDLKQHKQQIEQNKQQQGSAIFNEQFSLVKAFYQKLAEHFDRDLMIFDDNIIYAQSFFPVSSQNHFYPNSGISSLGHAIPAAIGARFSQNKIAMAIIGDGGFQMCCMEIMTAVNYQIPITIILFNNASMGLIRKNQFQQYQQRFINCDFINPDYAKLAQSFAIEYYKINHVSELDDLFQQCDFKNQINLIEIPVDKNAFPNYQSNRE